MNAPVVLLNVGHWWRNILVLGTPLGVSGDVTRNQLFTIAGFLSNLLRGASVHLVLPFRPFNEAVERAILWVHQSALGLSASDPRTTIVGTEYRLPVTRFDNPLFVSENVTGNPIHLVLFLIAFFLYFFHAKNRSGRQSAYLLILLSIPIVFNILIAWQPWVSRLHLPFFVLASPFAGVIIARYLKLPGVYCLAALLLFCSLPCVVFSTARPLVSQSFFRTASKVSIYEVPRMGRYFVTQPKLKELYENAVLDIQSARCWDTGIIASGNAWEYPVWAIAQQAESPLRFRSVLVENPSSGLAVDHPLPCSLLAIQRPDMGDEIVLQGLMYQRSAVNGDSRLVSVYYPVRRTIASAPRIPAR